MNEPRRKPSIVHVAAEVAPLAKVGGLGDVVHGLSRELERTGVAVRIIIPRHRVVKNAVTTQPEIENVAVNFAGATHEVSVHTTTLPGTEIPVHLVDAPDFFDVDDDIYGTEPGAAGLGDLRYLFFSAAIRPVINALSIEPDVLHVHDWHTALVPVLERTEWAFDPSVARTANVLTIHNARFQGRMPVEDFHRSGLRRDLLSAWYLLEGDRANLLRGGATFAERITTVSPGYARECLSHREGCGMETVLEPRGEDFSGIVNGIDTDVWDPMTDSSGIIQRSADDLDKKAEDKAALCAELGLSEGDGPLLGFVGRLTDQKGVDRIADVLPLLMRRRRFFARRRRDVRAVVLGRGDPELQERMRALAARHPDKIAYRDDFDEGLAHRIQAAADIILMPSRFEPCGLTQLIAYRYGTVPVVRATGGLADTVRPHDRRRGRDGDGFQFEEDDPLQFLDAIRRALHLYRRPSAWRAIVERGVSRDVSWTESALKYRAIYDEAIEARRRSDREDALLSHLRTEPHGAEIPFHQLIPTHYKVDRLHLMPKDPGVIIAQWEVQGEAGCAILDDLTEEERHGSRWELRMEETDTGACWSVDVEGLAKNWFMDVEADRTYVGELWMTAGDREPRCVARSNVIMTPPESVVS